MKFSKNSFFNTFYFLNKNIFLFCSFSYRSNLDAKPLGFEKLARLIASRAQVIQSKWQQAYPQMKDEQGRPISATIASLARAMSVTAIGASGAVVVALAGNPPERREENEGESNDEEGTKE